MRKEREKVAIDFDFASPWLKKIGERFFTLITLRNNHNRVITFDSCLKTAIIFVVRALDHCDPYNCMTDNGRSVFAGR